jgi:hypothetical protein
MRTQLRKRVILVVTAVSSRDTRRVRIAARQITITSVTSWAVITVLID